MLQRAAVLTEFSGTSGALDSFADADAVGSWAKDAVKWNVGSGLIVGSGGLLRPNDNITRAESATVILRLLQKAELVDVRS
ncbi:MAG: S-layer homology domain-containing protein [Lawsonibacter sp.]|nr:S-layer homology domain-containing protein [Lawsonibacter sp.]